MKLYFYGIGFYFYYIKFILIKKYKLNNLKKKIFLILFICYIDIKYNFCFYLLLFL